MADILLHQAEMCPTCIFGCFKIGYAMSLSRKLIWQSSIRLWLWHRSMTMARKSANSKEVALEHEWDGIGVVERPSNYALLEQASKIARSGSRICCTNAQARKAHIHWGSGTSCFEFVEPKPGQFQDRVVDFVQQEFRIQISQQTVSNILRREDFTRERGSRVNNKYNVEKDLPRRLL